MKINDYVKYQGKVYRIQKSWLSYISYSIWYTLDFEKGIDAHENCLTPLTPEETLEYFKGRFEKLGYQLHKEINIFEIIKKSSWKLNIEVYKTEFYVTKQSIGKLENTLIDLIREFQQWYWRDK